MSHFPPTIANWWLGDKLGSGFSGSIFKAVHIHTGQTVALKLQPVDVDCPTNRYERNFYPYLQGGKGMPRLYAQGVEGPWDYLAIDLLGSSLDSLVRKSGSKVMDLRSVCCIAMQVIQRLQFMHHRGILHRDIQLGNCVVGLKPNETLIYMIDFGFSKRYLDDHGRHIPDSRVRRDFIGNYWFSSVRVHCNGRVPSRRDDLEALALMLIHLLTPNGLTWTRNGVPKTDEAHRLLMRQKENATPEDLCSGLPQQFEDFLKYCRRLAFSQQPSYEFWIEEFRALAEDSGFPTDDAFIWPPPSTTPNVQAKPRKKAYLNKAPTKDVEGILNGLANMNIGNAPGAGAGGERQVLGQRNINQAPPLAQPTKEAVMAKKKLQMEPSNDVIEISSDEDENARNPRNNAPAAVRMGKAMQLNKLRLAALDASDNVALAKVVDGFVGVLQDTRSRGLTKEGFSLLDALYKQLADPSVYVLPLRKTKTRGQSLNEENKDYGGPADARLKKMNKLVVLRRDVGAATSNKTIARLVADFGKVIDETNGRTVTKDAFLFLDSLAKRLKTMQ